MSTLGIGSYFDGSRVRQQYWRDPARVVEETCGNWRPPRQKPQQIAKKVSAFKPATDFAIKLAEASKKLDLN